MATDVTALITAAQAYTSGLVSQASGAMESASNAVGGVGYSWPGASAATMPDAPPSDIPLELPTLSDITLAFPSDPSAAPNFQDISAFDAGSAPSLSATLPTLDLPTKPSQVAAFTGTMPSINTSFVFPEPPSSLLNPLIADPALSNHTVPDKPQVMIPGFTGVAPTNDAIAPNNLDTVLSSGYSQSAVSMPTMISGYVETMMQQRFPGYAIGMSAIENQLTTYLKGGTGLDPSVENAIYARARAKNDVEAKRVQDAAFADVAARGFTIPGGALTSALTRARQDAANANAKQATDIAVMQAEMEQKNLQFAVTTSAGLRGMMVNATLSYMQNLVTINGQALDYAKSVVNALVETYNVAVKAFASKIDAYKADAQVFETRLKGAMAYIELYNAEIKGLEAMVNVDRAKVDVFRARIEALSGLANVYRAQVEAAQGRAGLEKLKLDVFQGQVQAYTSLVQAKNAEWQGYSAAVQGQEAKVKIYATQVQAYTAQISGYSATIQAKSEAVKATAMTNQARATQYQAMLSGYQSRVTASGEKARAEIAVQGQLIQAFRAKVQAAVGSAQVAQGYYKATADVAIANAGNTMKAIALGIESQRAYGQTVAQLGTANAQIYGNLASSAMAGMNTLVSQSAAA